MMEWWSISPLVPTLRVGMQSSVSGIHEASVREYIYQPPAELSDNEVHEASVQEYIYQPPAELSDNKN